MRGLISELLAPSEGGEPLTVEISPPSFCELGRTKPVEPNPGPPFLADIEKPVRRSH